MVWFDGIGPRGSRCWGCRVRAVVGLLGLKELERKVLHTNSKYNI